MNIAIKHWRGRVWQGCAAALLILLLGIPFSLFAAGHVGQVYEAANGTRYRLENELGSGGYGVVFRATTLNGQNAGREVAFKIFKRAEGDVAELLTSVQKTKQLWNTPSADGTDGEHLIKIYEAGEFTLETPSGPGQHEVVMVQELLFSSLAKYAADFNLFGGNPRYDDQMKIRLLAAVAKQMVQMVNELGAKDLVFGDISPGNIMMVQPLDQIVAGHGQLKLVDPDSAVRFNEPIKGATPAYAAPGVQRGTRASNLADFYACGATLYYLAFGRQFIFDFADETNTNPQDAWQRADTRGIASSLLKDRVDELRRFRRRVPGLHSEVDLIADLIWAFMQPVPINQYFVIKTKAKALGVSIEALKDNFPAPKRNAWWCFWL